MSLIYSTETKQTVTRLRAALPQAILLEGQKGVGLYTIARTIAGQSIGAVIQPTDVDGKPDTGPKGMIRLAQIRELQQYARGKSTDIRVFIIDDADKMNGQAQNTFLKLLEEPGEHIRFILTSHQPYLLLPTVLSRVQRVVITPISILDSQHFIKKLGVTDPKKTQQLLYIASGRPAELSRLVANEATSMTRPRLQKMPVPLLEGSSVSVLSSHPTTQVTGHKLYGYSMPHKPLFYSVSSTHPLLHCYRSSIALQRHTIEY